MVGHLFWWQTPFGWGFGAWAAAWGQGWGLELAHSQRASKGILKVSWRWGTLRPPRNHGDPRLLGQGYTLRPDVTLYTLTQNCGPEITVTCPESLRKMVAEPELESTSPCSFCGGMWASEPMTMSTHLALVSVYLPLYKTCQELLTLCVLPLTQRLLSPPGLDGY